MEAFSLLLPEGWGFECGIGWSLDEVMMPASCGFTARGDNVTIRALPGKAFFWTGLPHVRLSHPVGSRYLGATVCPQLNAGYVLKALVLPSIHTEVGAMSIVEESPAVTIDNLLGFGAAFQYYGSPSSEGARLRVEYARDGREYEEELFCTITSLKYSIPGGSGIDYTFWMADNIFSFTAEKGELDKSAGILQTVMRSFRLNPGWFEKYNRVIIYLKDHQIFKPSDTRQLSRDVDKDPQKTSFYHSYSPRHSAYRWIADNLGGSRYTCEYYDPIQQICVDLPCGYDHTWANDSGEYLLSNRRDLQPDSGFTEIWKMMEPIGLDLPGPEPSTATAT